jgi:spermidine synthase
MYHVFQIATLATLLYLLSYFFCRTGFFSTAIHKRIWNSILAVAFLISASAGIFIALQINYKWNIPFIKPLLKWHAEFGIGLAVTGLFHLIWHYSYFRKLFLPAEISVGTKEISGSALPDIRTNLFIVGLISSSFQLLLLREMMNITGGSELITGIFLGSWLTGSAAGSSLAGRSRLNNLKRINLIFAISPLISLLMMFLLSALFMDTGETPSFLTSIFFTFLVNIPFCLASGFIFVKLTAAARDSNQYLPGKSFSIETAGGVFAGILIPVLTSGLLNTYQVILLLILLTLAYVLNNFFLSIKRHKFISLLLFVMAASAVIIFQPDILFRHLLLPAVSVISSEDTPYGNITKADYKGEKSIYYNHRLIAYNSDATEREEDIHYAMLQRENPAKVILISGSPVSQLPEIFKYHVEKVTYIERDPLLAHLYLGDSIIKDSRLLTMNTDALRFLRMNHDKADVIIMLVPPPTTLLLNRYYTNEFFTLVGKNLNPGGVFVCSPGPADLYLNKEALNLCSSVQNSLSNVFRCVRPVSGNKLYYLASDEQVSVSFCSLVEKRNIKTVYVNSDYMSDDIIAKRSEEIASRLDPETKRNNNSHPVGLFYRQSYSMSKDSGEKVPAMLIILIVFALPLTTVRKRDITMFFSASALAGFEIISIFTLQILAGNMYQLTGLIMAGLMTGLAIGAGYGGIFPDSFSVRRKGVVLALFYILTAFGFNYISKLTIGPVATILIVIVVFIPSLITGQIFRELTTSGSEKEKFQATYSTDLIGSAFGFILISGFVVPVLGITIAIFMSALLIFTGILFSTFGKK